MQISTRIVMLASALSFATAAIAQSAPPQSSTVNAIGGVPVFPYDIKDRPYKVIGTVHVGVRKGTIFSKEASQAKVYQELWKHAKKLGADAVVSATYGDSHITMLSWGTTNATGIAVRFVNADAPQAPAPTPQAPTTSNGTAAAPQQH